MTEPNQSINSVPGLNDVPQRPLEIDEAINVIQASTDAVNAGKTEKQESFINTTEPYTRARFILDALETLPKTTKNWFVKRIILWQVGGDTIRLDMNHTITFSRKYNGKGYSVKTIADILLRSGYKNMVDELVLNKDITYLDKVKLLVDDCVNVVCDSLSKRNSLIVPVSGGI